MKAVNSNVCELIKNRVNNLIRRTLRSRRKDKIGMNVYWPVHRQIKIRVHIQIEDQVKEDLL